MTTATVLLFISHFTLFIINFMFGFVQCTSPVFSHNYVDVAYISREKSYPNIPLIL